MSVGANRLRELRKKMGKSQEIVGGLLNISQSRMSDYENGICAIPSDVLILFASPPQILCKLHKQCIIKANEWRKKKWAEKEHLRKRQDES